VKPSVAAAVATAAVAAVVTVVAAGAAAAAAVTAGAVAAAAMAAAAIVAAVIAAAAVGASATKPGELAKTENQSPGETLARALNIKRFEAVGFCGGRGPSGEQAPCAVHGSTIAESLSNVSSIVTE
jgi:hypothetical protein